MSTGCLVDCTCRAPKRIVQVCSRRAGERRQAGEQSLARGSTATQDVSALTLPLLVAGWCPRGPWAAPGWPLG